MCSMCFVTYQIQSTVTDRFLKDKIRWFSKYVILGNVMGVLMMSEEIFTIDKNTYNTHFKIYNNDSTSHPYALHPAATSC